VPTNRVTGILNGRRAMTGDTTLRVAHFFGISAEFWLNLQSVYELRLTQQKAGESINDLPTLKRLKSDTKVGFCYQVHEDLQSASGQEATSRL
jgi:plasmid maintenance system antidote protein VapI